MRHRSTAVRILRRLLVGILLIAAMAIGGAALMHASLELDREAEVDPDGSSRRLAIGEVRSWGYQLQGVDLATLAGSPFDLLVIDPTALPEQSRERASASLGRLQRRHDGSPRLVLAYLSIGEAEDYRGYWRPEWVVARPDMPVTASAGLGTATPPDASGTPRPDKHALPPQSVAAMPRPLRVPDRGAPAWLGEENIEWRGNYRVSYWHPDWQGLLFGTAEAALDRIIAMGFDGVYLDRADVYTSFRASHPKAEAQMIDLVARLAKYARAQNPNFLVVLQNAEELLAHRQIRAAIDAAAKEDLLFGIGGTGIANDRSDVTASLHFLHRARKAGKPVLVVEYLDDRAVAAQARRDIAAQGFVPYVAPRDLARLNLEF